MIYCEAHVIIAIIELIWIQQLLPHGHMDRMSLVVDYARRALNIYFCWPNTANKKTNIG